MRTVLAYLALAALTFSVALFVVIATTLGFEVKPNGLLERTAGIFSRGVMRAAGARILVITRSASCLASHAFMLRIT